MARMHWLTVLVLVCVVGCQKAADRASVDTEGQPSTATKGASSEPGSSADSDSSGDISTAAAGTGEESSTESQAADDFWQGLERHEIQLDQKLLVVRGPKGVIGCPYLNVASFEKFDEACAIIPAVDTDGMLESEVVAVTPKAEALGIKVGMPGREALDKIR